MNPNSVVDLDSDDSSWTSPDHISSPSSNPNSQVRRRNNHEVISLLHSPESDELARRNNPRTPNIQYWTCRSCTLENSYDRSICGACTHPRNSRLFSGSEASFPFASGGAIVAGLFGAADGYASGNGMAQGAVGVALVGAFGGALIGETLRPASAFNSRDLMPRRFPSNSAQDSRLLRNENTLGFRRSSASHVRVTGMEPIESMSYDRLLEVFGDGNENRNLSASPHVIGSLPVTTIRNTGDLFEENRQCAICIENFALGDERKVLPCWHGFHTGCVDRWLGEKGWCPVCKTGVEGESG